MSAALVMPQGLLVPDFTPKHIVFIDFETYFDQRYKLKTMTTASYVKDERFEMLCVGVKIDGAEAVLMEHDEFKEWSANWDWSTTALGAHSPSLEPLVCAHHYGIVPGFWFDTISMAHALGLGGSLKFLMDHFGVGQKGDELGNAKGKRRKDFTDAEFAALGVYCLGDTEGCHDIFYKMSEGFPEAEFHLIDATIRMFSEPQLLLDEPMVQEYMVEERERKAALLERCGLDKKGVGSNEKLAAAFRELGVEPPVKVSKKTKKQVYAFAKDDVGMLELLEHEVDDVRWLAEARIAVKSTINSSRGARFLELGKNGQRMNVQLNYYGAHTGRWSGAGKCNFQNLERTNKKDPKRGRLKKSLLAPPGHKVVAVDSNAIEARGVFWLAELKRMVEAFAQNRDIYSEQAASIYGRPIDRKARVEDEIPGFVGKVCLAGETLVLTRTRGWVPLVEVTTEDTVWDGVEWVGHKGLLYQGTKEVLSSRGVAATHDHEILTERGWVEWSGVLRNRSLFQSALWLANLPSSSIDGTLRVKDVLLDGSRSSGVAAGGKDLSTDRTCFVEEALDARGAQGSKRARSDTGSIEPLCLTTSIGHGCSTDVRRASLDAITRAIRFLGITAVAVFLCVMRGVKTQLSFFATSFRSLVGMNLLLSSTASTTNEGMSLGTFASFQGLRTLKTSDKLETCSNGSWTSKRTTRVYDLLSAGPRRRFTILSSEGPLIVSNCVLGLGYGQGGAKLGENFLKGKSGPPVQFTMTEVETLSVDLDKFIQDERKMKAVQKMISRLDLEALTIHCAVADHLVKKYRTHNKEVPALWKLMGDVIRAMDQGIEGYFGPNDCLQTVKNGIILPNGFQLRYPELRQSKKGDHPEDDEEDDNGADAWRRKGYSYFDGKKRTRIYGGMMTENVCQALARIVVAEQMLHVKAVTGFRPVMGAHDEWTFVVPESDAHAMKNFVIETMKTPPSWALGWPLNAEGGVGDSYGACK